jgi:plastocyanin
VVWLTATIKPLVYGLVLLAVSCGAYGSQISGRILIQGKASRKSVAPIVYGLRGEGVPEGSRAAPSGNPFDRVAVWLESNAGSARAGGAGTARMQQHNRHFDPELLIVPVGASVEFPNLDPIFHNIFSLSRAQSFDLGYYPEGHSRSVTFPRAGIVQVYCHVHPSMYGVIVVTSSAWYGKPSQEGGFSWSDVPPGKYRLMVWHNSTGLVHRKLVVPEQGSIEVTVAVPEDDVEQ